MQSRLFKAVIAPSLVAAVAAAVFAAGIARAQDATGNPEQPLSQVTLPTPDVKLQLDESVPPLWLLNARDRRPVYYPQSCDQFVAPGADRPRGDYSTWFSFRLSTDGNLQDVTLFKSSGNSTIDAATLECARHIHAAPLIVSGVPAEVSWIMAYDWRYPVQKSAFSYPSPTGRANECTGYPPEARRRDEEGPVTVAFHIGTDGVPGGLSIARSSGSDTLDNAALVCVGAFRYYPATEDGQRVVIDARTRVIWLSPNRTHFMDHGRVVIRQGSNSAGQ